MASRSWSSAGWYELSALACGTVIAIENAPASAVVATTMRRVPCGIAVKTVLTCIAAVTRSLRWDGVHELFVMSTRNTVVSDLLLGAAALAAAVGAHTRLGLAACAAEGR